MARCMRSVHCIVRHASRRCIARRFARCARRVRIIDWMRTIARFSCAAEFFLMCSAASTPATIFSTSARAMLFVRRNVRVRTGSTLRLTSFSSFSCAIVSFTRSNTDDDIEARRLRPLGLTKREAAAAVATAAAAGEDTAALLLLSVLLPLRALSLEVGSSSMVTRDDRGVELRDCCGAV